ncbi:ribonuclease Y [Microlunatus sp. Y2014]|uniref:ribonuclease Y n=1 Tax=Microlunatus sp. Y2014 TaxID=3418488 RepID=UPI003DA71951
MDGTQIALVLGALLLLVIVVLLVLVLRRVSARRVEEANRLAEAEAAAQRDAAATRAEAEREARDVVADARRRAADLTAEAERRLALDRAAEDESRADLARHRDEVRAELRALREEQSHRELRLSEREARLDRDGGELEQVRITLEGELEQHRREAQELAAQSATHQAELERIAELTTEQARAELLTQVEQDSHRQAALLARDIEDKARRGADQQARMILVGVMQRLASEQTTEATVTSVALPGEDMKGRIIGREGRNIRTFEQVTGANLVIDDTPEMVLVSCFDPVRREEARLALVELVEDGRIHPTRIEEAHRRSQETVKERCHQAAEDALLEVGITDLAPQLVDTLGTLRYRTSYGQNVLKHLVECAHLAGMIAAELGLDVAACKRSAFLHDIGKALTHEAEGSHALVGADLARRHGEHPDIVHAIEAHHNEVDPETVEAVLVQVVDAISGARPGARRESVETYMKRMTRLEKIARSQNGVDKVFAMQAGRDVRVMVKPEVVDDVEAQVLARTIVQQIEAELTYPGQIKVTVVRESRATATAK